MANRSAPQSLVNAALARTNPDLLPPLLAEADRVFAIDDQASAADAAALSDALCTLAGAVAGTLRTPQAAPACSNSTT